jgi:hypothetical protein
MAAAGQTLDSWALVLLRGTAGFGANKLGGAGPHSFPVLCSWTTLLQSMILRWTLNAFSKTSLSQMSELTDL